MKSSPASTGQDSCRRAVRIVDVNHKGLLSPETQKIVRAVMADIEDAIIKGPVVFAGGALITGRVFGYDAKARAILIPNDLWMELSHLGYWVSQAVILQWAEKTAKLGEALEVATVVNLLLDKEDERSTLDARKVFSSLDRLECVWTGVSLRDNYIVRVKMLTDSNRVRKAIEANFLGSFLNRAGD